MKGIVFTEFLELVDEQFSPEICEQLIERSNLPSKGIYTSVGTYPHGEMAILVSNLATLTGIAQADLLKAFGRHMFAQFLEKFPSFFEGISSALEFLPRVDSFVHLEVKKLYPDAELPTFVSVIPNANQLDLFYESERHLPDLAEGLILACVEHFGDQVELIRACDRERPQRILFTLRRVNH
jgi:hypothetical protein